MKKFVMLYNSFAFCSLINTLFKLLLPEGGVLQFMWSVFLSSFAPNSIVSDNTRPPSLAPISTNSDVSPHLLWITVH
jgi:hypothetical protein